MYDVIIVGAGPAGSTLARLIGNQHRVLLLDRRNLSLDKESGPEKCCGGLIAPDAQYMLAVLGLGVPQKVLVGPQLFTVRTIDMENNLERYYQRHYINIDREKFDAWLVSLIPHSVDIRCETLVKSFTEHNGYISVRFSHKGKEYEEKTRLLVGADGAHSLVRKQLALPEISPYISIQEWFEVKENQSYFSAIFDKEVTDFYSWTIPKENFLLVGSALKTSADPASKLNLLKQKLGLYGFDLSVPVRRNGAFIVRPQHLSQIATGRGNIILVGEAAGWISPTSAEGLSYAFRSARALAKSLKQGHNACLDTYNRETKALRANILGKNLKSPAMFNTTLRRLVMSTGLMSMKVQK